jgi:hypothetical protein
MMFEPDEKEVIDLEPAAETAPDPVVEGETPPAEAEETELVVSIGNEEPTPDPVAEEARQAPEWVKELRKQNREYQKRIRQLERNTQAAPAAQGETNAAPPKKPTLQDVDYDTGAYEARLDDWYKAKAKFDQQQAELQRKQDDINKAWIAKLASYNTAKAELKVRDFDDAEAAMMDTLSVTQRGIILDGAKKPAIVMYALGKNPKKAAELAAIASPIAFAFAIADLERELKVTSRKPSAAPEQIPSGNAPKSGSVDNTLERLRDEAGKTGDFTKVMAYKRQQKRG